MTTINSVTLEVEDVAAAQTFYDEAFGLGPELNLRATDAPTSGFRAFTLSLVVSQPANVDALMAAALEAGASEIKPAKKGFWGYGGVLRAPDGAIWKVATSNKKDTGPASREVDEFILLLGVADVGDTKAFYAERGVPVAKSFGKKYVQFDTGSTLTLALYGRKALAKDAGVDEAGSGSARIVIGGDGGAFTDPDGFRWEAAAPAMVA
jgi:catechol 2,3-dioxygenase-like lactoylglutathione lyase family enzyme